jgi:hypothetical protein
MPKLLCTCGFVHNLSPIPDDGWKTIRDTAYDQLVDAHVLQRQLAPDDQWNDDTEKRKAFIEASVTIARTWGSMYECPRCGRLLWKRDGEDEFRSFYPEPLVGEVLAPLERVKRPGPSEDSASEST